MASSDPKGAARDPVPDGETTALEVEDAGRRRPFMRGIMVHSLVARGVGFDEAYRTANLVRDRFADLTLVQKSEIAKAIREVLGDTPFRDEQWVPTALDITVTGSGKRLPFSKGLLSQSLLAAAIDPNDAFDGAREIERELLRRDTREIDRHELRGLAYEALSHELGPQTAERYLIWRRYQEPERPVIILLGGTAGVGKTSLALEVAHRFGIGRVLSTDSIRQIMRVMLSAELAPSIHGSSYDGSRLLSNDPGGRDPVLEGFRAQTAAVSVGVRASIDRAIAENASMVLDGVSLVPGLFDLEAYEELADVVFLVVAALDEDAFVGRFHARAADERRRGTHRYLENLDSIQKIQDYFLSLAERADVPIVDNVSFDRSVLLIIRHVTEALRKRGDHDLADLL